MRPLGYFKMEERGTNLKTEFIAGTTTFLTLAYIVAINPMIIADSGGSCHVCRKYPGETPCAGGNTPRSSGCCIDNQYAPFFIPDIFTPAYEDCMQEVKRDLVVVTAGMSALACFLMGTMANLPFALAPGMGLNAYFTYGVVGFRGSGLVSYETALAAVFIEGLIFIVVAASGIRAFVVHSIPKSIKLATTGGIGLFLAILGLQTAEGIGLAVYDGATVTTLGGCPPENRIPIYSCPRTKGIPGVPDGLETAGPASMLTWMMPGANGTYVPSEHLANYRKYIENPGGMPWESCLKGTPNVYTCDLMFDAASEKYLGGGGSLESATTWLGLVGLMVCGFMYKRKWTGAMILSILFCAIIAWRCDPEDPDGSKVCYWKLGGDYEYFKKFAEARSADSVVGKLDFSATGGAGVGLALGMFFIVDFFDTSATLMAMGEYSGMLDATGNFEGQYAAFLVDGIATTVGALCGTSPVTTYIESAPGILEGGKTGLTAIFVSFYFLLCLFFAPVLSQIPPYATGFALVVVGALMLKGVVKIDWAEPGEAIPAFLVLIIMPVTYNIGYGFIAGWAAWYIINGLSFVVDFVQDRKSAMAKLREAWNTYLENGRAGLPWNAAKAASKSASKSALAAPAGAAEADGAAPAVAAEAEGDAPAEKPANELEI